MWYLQKENITTAMTETSFLRATMPRGSPGWNHLSLNQKLITHLLIPQALQCDTSSSQSVYSSPGEMSNTQTCLGKGGRAQLCWVSNFSPATAGEAGD